MFYISILLQFQLTKGLAIFGISNDWYTFEESVNDSFTFSWNLSDIILIRCKVDDPKDAEELQCYGLTTEMIYIEAEFEVTRYELFDVYCKYN